MHTTYFNWSSGKDATLALYHVLKDSDYKISTLITTVNEDYGRVSMHGLRIELLEQQAECLGLPLRKIGFSGAVSMESYDHTMHVAVSELKKSGNTHCIFGDIFLEDLKAYREEQLAKVGVKPVFPIWKRDTRELLQEFISLGFKAITVCVNAKVLDKSFCGRILDQSFIEDLPDGVDPCGENGEFHTFVFDGPIFKRPIAFEKGEVVKRTYQPAKDEDTNCYQKEEDQQSWDTSFWYCDLIPN